MTIDEFTEKMPWGQKIVVQNDGNDDSDYEPFIGTVDEFRGSDLYNQIADLEVEEHYSDGSGAVWICYCWEEY